MFSSTRREDVYATEPTENMFPELLFSIITISAPLFVVTPFANNKVFAGQNLVMQSVS